MNTKRAVLAAAAAALFTTGVGAGPADAGEHGEGEKVKCEGVNACKGQADCHTASHDCAGKNACKGKGWKYMTAEECEKAKAAMES